MHCDRRGPRPITVPATVGPASVTLITAPCRLVGWSLAGADLSGTEGAGTQAAPAAGTTIASFTAFAPGERVINWTVELTGTPGAADVDNFGLFNGVTQIATSENAGAAGRYPQVPVQTVIPGAGAVIAVKAIGAAAAGSVYLAQVATTGLLYTEGVLTDTGQLLAAVAAPPGGTDTRHLGKHGLYVSTQITLQVNDGTMSGVIWIDDFDAHLAS